MNKLSCTAWDEKQALGSASGGTAEWELKLLVLFSNAFLHSDLMQHSMPQGVLCHATTVGVLVFQSTVHMSEVCTICDYICIYGLVWLWKMIALRFNKQKSVFALMKGCCHLFCRSATIRAPCGFCDRLFFCITLNKRVQCINLTLPGETKKGPLIQ